MLLHFVAERLAEASQESGSKYAIIFFCAFVPMRPSDDSHELHFLFFSCFLLQSPVEVDKATIKCETSPPPSPRSLRLETNFAQFTGSLEDGRG